MIIVGWPETISPPVKAVTPAPFGLRKLGEDPNPLTVSVASPVFVALGVYLTATPTRSA